MRARQMPAAFCGAAARHAGWRLPGEPAAGVNDIHFHPVEPRSLRLTLMASF